jgi:hypothetical protein
MLPVLTITAANSERAGAALSSPEALENDKRAGTIGFALTTLQRRLASSPEAIYQSLRRRRERMESRLRELEVLQRGLRLPKQFRRIPCSMQRT